MIDVAEADFDDLSAEARTSGGAFTGLRTPESGLARGSALGKPVSVTGLLSTEKIGVSSRYKVLPLDEIAGIITDSPQSDPTLSDLRRNGISIINAHD